LQGEVQELELEAVLRTKFPFDTIDPVPKGEYGGDTLQRVVGPMGQVCGTILWESKRTKNWSDGWLAKLRDDQRERHRRHRENRRAARLDRRGHRGAVAGCKNLKCE
ncbi:MAG: DUF2130 domain-containing protein, partial [Phycisphaerae bacterium]